MSIHRAGGMIPSRFDTAPDVRASNASERPRTDAPSFKLPAPRESDAAASGPRTQPHARDARQRPAMHARSEHEREVQRELELDRPQPVGAQHGTRARSTLADSQVSDADDSTAGASQSQATTPRTTPKPSQPNPSAERRLDARAGTAEPKSDDTGDAPTPTASKDSIERADPSAAPSNAPNVTPSLAERMLALLSGDLVAPATATVPAAAANATGCPAGSLSGGLVSPGPVPTNTGTAPGALSATVAPTFPATAAPTPAGVATLPATPVATPSADISATLAAAVESFGTALAHAGAGAKESDSTAPDASIAPGSIDASALLARAPSELSATRVVQAAALALPADLDAGFGDELGSRIVWMAEQKLGHAEIRVNPENLGPIDIRLQIDGNRISAQFQAANPDVRHALQAGMGHLRDLLGRHGMELSDSQVGSQPQKGDQRAGTGSRGPQAGGLDGDGASPATTTVRALRARGLIDEYV